MESKTVKHRRAFDASLSKTFIAALIKNGVNERDANLYVELRGLAGEEPKSLRKVSQGLSAERVRQIVLEVETGPLRAFVESNDSNNLRDAVSLVLTSISQHAPGSNESICATLNQEGRGILSAGCVVRLADVIGCVHGLRLSNWTSRSKFKSGDPHTLAAPHDAARNTSVTAIVPTEMPEVFDSFINFARKFSRGSGVIAANQVADRYSKERRVAITQSEVVAFLSPFAVHLGRHNGDDWFAFMNSANDFLRKVSTRVSLFGRCSFELLCDFHDRYNRSQYTSEDGAIPPAVLHSAIELAGYFIDGDSVTLNSAHPPLAIAGRGASEMQTRMVKIFKDTLAASGRAKSVTRIQLVTAMKTAGIRESTAHIYLGNQGLFICRKGLCQLADEACILAPDKPKPKPKPEVEVQATFA